MYSAQTNCYSSNPKVLSRYKTCLVLLVVVLFQKLLWPTSWSLRIMFTLRRSVPRCRDGLMPSQMYSSSLKKGTKFMPRGKILSPSYSYFHLNLNENLSVRSWVSTAPCWWKYLRQAPRVWVFLWRLHLTRSKVSSKSWPPGWHSPRNRVTSWRPSGQLSFLAFPSKTGKS